jgi:predicted transcriptional regulator
MADIVTAPQHTLDLKVFSIHTPYVDLIRQGIKKYELRSYSPGVKPGDWSIIYETSPSQHISTVFKVAGFWCLTPDLAWSRHGEHLGISHEKYQQYFNGKHSAFGVEIEMVRTFEPIPLSTLSGEFGFHPPQGVARWGKKLIHKRILDATIN